MHKIYVVGAGPGDPSLLTLKAKKYLERADLIYFDPALHPNLFFMSKRTAKWISLAHGKGKHLQAMSLRQSSTDHSILFLLPGEPNHHATLAFLDKNGFPYELIPGIKSQRDSAYEEKKSRVIVLRGIDQAQGMIEELLSLNLDVIQCPMIEIIPNHRELKRITKTFITPFTTIIFTSANGVHYFLSDLRQKGIDIRILANKRIFTVGAKTEHCLNSHGLIADGTPATFVAESILDLFGSHLQEEKILIPTADGARDILSKELRDRDAKVCTLKIYKNITPKAKPLSIRDGDMVIFTSSSTAEHFFTSRLYKMQRIIPFCIGEITRKSVAKYISGDIYTSTQATAESLVDSVKRFLTVRCKLAMTPNRDASKVS